MIFSAVYNQTQPQISIWPSRTCISSFHLNFIFLNRLILNTLLILFHYPFQQPDRFMQLKHHVLNQILKKIKIVFKNFKCVFQNVFVLVNSHGIFLLLGLLIQPDDFLYPKLLCNIHTMPSYLSIQTSFPYLWHMHLLSLCFWYCVFEMFNNTLSIFTTWA